METNKQISEWFDLMHQMHSDYFQMIRSKPYEVGAKIYVEGEKRPYKVMASGEQYVIATKPHFKTVLYTILDLKNNWRAPDDRIFCSGYETTEQCKERLDELISGDIELSRRRGVPLCGGSKDVTKVIFFDGTHGKLPNEIYNTFYRD